MHHDATTIDMDDLIGYKFVKEYNELPQTDIVKENFDTEGNFLIKFMNGCEYIITYNDLINIK